VRLVEDAAQGPDGDLVLLGNDHRVDGVFEAADELYVAALLTFFDEADRLEPSLDFPERLRAKPRQPLPRSGIL